MKDLDTLTSATLAVFRLHQVLVNDGDALAGGWGLNSAKWKTLGAIAMSSGQITAPDIARSMGLSRQGAQKQLNGLMENGRVTRIENRLDARAPLYTLTARGTRVYEKLSAAWAQRSEKLASGIDESDLLTTVNVLDRIAQAIVTHPQAQPKKREKT